jgi:hypothetical protein
MKKCQTCKVEKEENEFYKNERRCKDCCRIRRSKFYYAHLEQEHETTKAYYAKNAEKWREHGRAYYATNAEKYRKMARERQRNNPEKRREAERRYRKNNVNYKISRYLRTRVYCALMGIAKAAHTLDMLGCDVEELKKHLESKFRPGMTWDNYGRGGWNVDHALPCSKFDLTKREEQFKCFHYSNLQPLWETTDIARQHGDMESIGNINKGNKILTQDRDILS